MSVVDLVMPKLGESIMEATILKWHKQPGDKVEQDETILDIATDKVDSEVPSIAEGTIEEILFNENDVVPIGTVIARIKTTADNSQPQNNQPQQPFRQESHGQPLKHEYEEADVVDSIPYVPPAENKHQASGNNSSAKFYSPLVMNIASSEGISMQELENIPGTGQDGRVSKKDIIQYIEQRKTTDNRQQTIDKQSQRPVVVFEHEQKQSSENQQLQTTNYQASTTQNVEIIEMDRMRKMIAKHMVDSKNISAHVTSFSECDVTNMVLWREKMKKEFEKREGEKITFTPLFIEAIVKCIKKYPWLNSSVDGDKIIIKKDINIGMATALPTGNLIVPVIKNADQLNLVGLTKNVNGLANAARNNKLNPDNTTGGTFTLTNVGTFGSIMGTPIINQPQVAIMAMGAIKKRPVVIETEQGDSIAIRHIMYISLSYDHRVIDGALGSTFLNAVSKELENFDSNRSI
ncbi:MAG TPA: dihydrolipoamide acetyltransferase family protein [Chitinophagaceae bacterium]|nr:dihydrolipoamide acetyltransferase family protein [Chitinophagaceae bacterium]